MEGLALSNEITPGKPIRIYQQDGNFKDFSTEDVVSNKLNSFLGWKCGAGVENLCIGFDGDILSASCGTGGSKSKNGKYGNIFEDFNLEDEWITCPQKFCSCGADLFIPKVKDFKNKNNLSFFNGQQDNSNGSRVDQINSPVAIERTFSTTNKQVFWELGRRCNYDCSYCHSYVHNDFEEHKSLEKLKFATEKLEKFSKGQKINFAISGGEPTINPDYLEWVKFLHSKGHHISTHSNGSRNADYYTELIRFSDLNISVHFEYYKKDKLLEVITAIVNEIYLRRLALLQSGHFEIMIMTQPGQTDLALEFEKELWRISHFAKYCNVNIMPIRGHESIEKKETKTGDTLLRDYSSEELQKHGSKTLDMHVLEIITSKEEEFSKYDELDGIADINKRYELLKRIQ